MLRLQGGSLVDTLEEEQGDWSEQGAVCGGWMQRSGVRGGIVFIGRFLV